MFYTSVTKINSEVFIDRLIRNLSVFWERLQNNPFAFVNRGWISDKNGNFNIEKEYPVQSLTSITQQNWVFIKLNYVKVVALEQKQLQMFCQMLKWSLDSKTWTLVKE